MSLNLALITSIVFFFTYSIQIVKWRTQYYSRNPTFVNSVFRQQSLLSQVNISSTSLHGHATRLFPSNQLFSSLKASSYSQNILISFIICDVAPVLTITPFSFSSEEKSSLACITLSLLPQQFASLHVELSKNYARASGLYTHEVIQ